MKINIKLTLETGEKLDGLFHGEAVCVLFGMHFRKAHFRKAATEHGLSMLDLEDPTGSHT